VGADDDAKEQEEDDDGRWRSYPGESARLPPRRCWWPKGERQRRIHGVDDSVVAVMVVVDVVVVVVAADDAAANVVGTGDAGSAHAVEVGVAVAAVDPVDGLGLEEPAGGPVLVVVVVAAAAAAEFEFHSATQYGYASTCVRERMNPKRRRISLHPIETRVHHDRH